MSRNRPTDSELLDAVIEFMDYSLKPELAENKFSNKTVFYHTLVSVNILKTVKRSLELGESQEVFEKNHLSALLKQDGSCEELNELLIEKIETEDDDIDTKSLLQTLKSISISKVAIDNPKYSTFKKLQDG